MIDGTGDWRCVGVLVYSGPYPQNNGMDWEGRSAKHDLSRLGGHDGNHVDLLVYILAAILMMTCES
jgi:hypothetical protein